MKKRIWAFLLAMCMIISIMPTAAFAGEEATLTPAPAYYKFDGTPTNEAGAEITLSKTAVYNEQTGKYEVTLSVDAEKKILPKPTKVIFVLDASYSMSACTNSAEICDHDPQRGSNCDITHNSFSHSDSRWIIAAGETGAIAGMKTNLTTTLGTNGVEFYHVLFGNEGNLTGNNGRDSYGKYPYNTSGFNVQNTYLMSGVDKAVDLAMGTDGKLDPDITYAMIIVSDGAATDNRYTSDKFNTFKAQGGQVYAVGFTFTNDSFKGMVNASNYYDAGDADELDVALGNIAQNIVGLITDPMGADVSLDMSSVSVSNGPAADVPNDTIINWTNPEGLEGKVELTYAVEIDPTEATAQKAERIEIALNGDAKLNYSYTEGGKTYEKSIFFPVPTAVIEAATLDVDYMLGNAKIKTDHEWINLTAGEGFEIHEEIPAVGEEIDGCWVTGVEFVGFDAQELEEPAAKAYKVIVTLSKTKPITEYDVTYSVTGDVPTGYTAPTGGKREVGSTVTVEGAPTATGYTFDGWKLDNEIVTSFEMPEKNVELTGKWTANPASVKWVVDGTVKSTQNGKTGDDVTEYSFTPDTGYTFSGWYADAEYTTEAIIAQTMLGEIVYYGKTEPNTNTAYAVEHYLQKLDGTGYDLKDTENLTGTTAAPVTATAKTYTGFTFDATVEGTVQSGTIAGDGSLVLKLFYTRNNYTVTFVDEDGTVLKEATEYAYGTPADSIAQPETPTKPDDAQYSFQFAGWSPVVADVTETVVYWATYEPAGDQKQYTFTFDANGGEWEAPVSGYEMTGTTKASKVYTYLDVVEEIEAPVREGYEFMGWFSKNNEGELTGKYWSFEGIKEYIIEDTTVYAKWAKAYQEPAEEENTGTLWVNLQDENGTWLGGTDTGIAVTEDYLVAAEAGDNVDYVYPASVEYNGKTYIYESSADGSAALNGAVEKDGQVIVVMLQYTLDELDDENDKPTGGDGIPDKYQALVTYKVVNGTWSDDSATDILKVFTLKTKEATAEEWIDIEGVALGEMPTGMKPAADYIDKGEWDKTHAATDKPVHGSVYTYTFTTTKAPSVSITKAVDGATTVKVGDTVKYTITVTNTGNVVLNNAKVVDELTGDEWTIEVLGVGESKTFNASYKATSKDAGKKIKNIAVVEVPEGPSDEAVNEAVTVKPNAPITPVGPAPKPQLSKADHLSYIIGYDDGTVRPLANITRAEVATIFFRLLTEESRAQFWSQENPFPDVTEDMWCNNAISTMFNAGIITGYPDGTFQPYAPVTRAEFATIAARFSNEVSDGVSDFFDVAEGYWAYEYIALAEDLGWVQGYEGYFRPLDNMTRAEVMTTVNRVLERSTRKENMLKDMIEWPDNDPAEWYYEAVQEATNSHEYYRTDEKVYKLNFYYEAWTKLIENPDWAALERTWSDANSQR